MTTNNHSEIKCGISSILKIVSILLLTSCQSNTDYLEKHFTNSEILMIGEMTEHFKISVCEKKFNKKCLNVYLESIRESYDSNLPIDTKLDGRQLEELTSKFDDST